MKANKFSQSNLYKGMSLEEKLNNSHLIILKIVEGSWHVDSWLPVLIPIVQFDSGQIWVEISN